MIIVSQMPGIIIHATHMIVSIFLFSPFPFWPSLLGNSTTLNILIDNNVVEVRVFVKRLNWFGMVTKFEFTGQLHLADMAAWNYNQRCLDSRAKHTVMD